MVYINFYKGEGQYPDVTEFCPDFTCCAITRPDYLHASGTVTGRSYSNHTLATKSPIANVAYEESTNTDKKKPLLNSQKTTPLLVELLIGGLLKLDNEYIKKVLHCLQYEWTRNETFTAIIIFSNCFRTTMPTMVASSGKR
ncbi:MAG: hypothetical protein PUP46_03835 [Endozoicomonas sp. (ex Botrylloides leachii)]|nr:hypothetical protein [Endozoicomonas sp. (ex Botrylloides leachii)]